MFFAVFLVFFLIGLMLALIFVPSEPKANDLPLFVTMTTLPERLVSDRFKDVVESILSQKVNALLLNIPYETQKGQTYTVPEWVENHEKIVVNRCEDMGPVTKVL